MATEKALLMFPPDPANLTPQHLFIFNGDDTLENDILIHTDGTNDRVGIQVFNPIEKLHLNEPDGATQVAIRFTNTASTAGANIGIDSLNHLRFANIDNFDNIFYTNATERMRILASGNVGINDSAPAHTLDITGDLNVTTDYNIGDTSVLNSTTLGTGIVNSSIDTNTGDLTNTGNLILQGDVTIDDTVTPPAITTDKLYNNGGDLTWNGTVLGGGIGAGDLTVTGNLIVEGDGTNTDMFLGDVFGSNLTGWRHNDLTATADYAMVQSSTGQTYINAKGGQNMNFRIGNSNHAVLSSVGLTLSAGKLLSTSATGGTQIQLTSTGGTQASIIGLATNGNDWELGARGAAAAQADSFYIYDQTAAAFRMTIDSSGNINNFSGVYEIGATEVLSSTTLGTGIVNSSIDTNTGDLTNTGHLNLSSGKEYRINGTDIDDIDYIEMEMATPQSLTTATNTDVNWDTTNFTRGGITESVGVFTFAQTGIYQINTYVNFFSNSTGLREVTTVHSTTGTLSNSIVTAVNGDATPIAQSLNANITDVAHTIVIKAQQTSGGNLSINGRISITRLGNFV